MSAPDIPGYALEGLIGEGSMGRVYKGRSLGDDRQVAIKILDALEASTAAVDRFEREVRTASALEHPHLVSLLDWGEACGARYLVMELVEGSSLEELLPLKALGPKALGNVLSKVAGALQSAHDAGVLHRDVKPGNILLDEAMEPRLVDFGLANFAAEQGQLTRTGVAVGTPMYMAPEILEGGSKRASAKSDVFALGVLLCQGLSGRHPFRGDTWPETCKRILACEPPALDEDLPEALRAACLDAVRRDPAERPTAGELAERLRSDDKSASQATTRARHPSDHVPALNDIDVGAELGPYQLERLIGRGSMGSVFVGRHRTSDIRHAVKVMRLSGKRERRQRFEREAQTLAKLAGHPGVVVVHHYEVLESGQAYCAMDLVEGEGLDVTLRRGALPLERALEIGASLAEALAAIHAAGVAHRDLKPSNVLLREDGAPVLTDFGLALDEELERITRSQQILGTPYYMAPEQARAQREQVGPASDVFALGTLLYEMTTGTRPVPDGNFLTVLAQILNAKPRPPRELRAEIPAALQALILRCLEKDPQERPNAAELGIALRKASRGERYRLAPPPGATTRRRRRLWTTVAIVVVALLVSLVVRHQAEIHAWERDLLAEAETARRAVDAFRLANLPVHIDPDARLPDPAPLRAARDALRALQERPSGPRSFMWDTLLRTQQRVETQLKRAEIDLALRAEDRPRARALLKSFPPGPTRQALLLTAGDDHAAIFRQLERLSAKTRAARIRRWIGMLAARRALDAHQLTGAQKSLSRSSPAPDSPLLPLHRRLQTRLAIARAASAANEPTRLAQHVARAMALDPASAQAEATRLARRLLAEWKGGTPPIKTAGILDALVSAKVELPPEAAPLYVAAARYHYASLDSAGLKRTLGCLQTALRLDPQVQIPPTVLSTLSRHGTQLVLMNKPREGFPFLLLSARAGLPFGQGVRRPEMFRLEQSGLLNDLTRKHPDDWAAFYWRGLGLVAWLREHRGRNHPDMDQRARRAAKLLDRCLAHEKLPLAIRVDLKLSRLRVTSFLLPQEFLAKVEAFFKSEPTYPERWQVLRIATEFLEHQGRPAKDRLPWVRRYRAALEARVKETIKDKVPPGGRKVSAFELQRPIEMLLLCLISSQRFSEAWDLLQKRETKALTKENYDMHRATYFEAKGEYRNALKDVQRYLRKVPDDHAALLLRDRCRRALRKR